MYCALTRPGAVGEWGAGFVQFVFLNPLFSRRTITSADAVDAILIEYSAKFSGVMAVSGNCVEDPKQRGSHRAYHWRYRPRCVLDEKEGFRQIMQRDTKQRGTP
jgi:hypothetical protein